MAMTRNESQTTAAAQGSFDRTAAKPQPQTGFTRNRADQFDASTRNDANMDSVNQGYADDAFSETLPDESTALDTIKNTADDVLAEAEQVVADAEKAIDENNAWGGIIVALILLVVAVAVGLWAWRSVNAAPPALTVEF